MKRVVNISGLKARLSEFVRMAEAGEEVLVCRRSLPVARLLPLESPRNRPRKLSDVRGWLEDEDDFPLQVEARRASI